MSMFIYEPIQGIKHICHAIAVGLNFRPYAHTEDGDMGAVLRGLAGEIACPICRNLSCAMQKADFIKTMRYHVMDVQFVIGQLDRGEITLQQTVEKLNALVGMQCGCKQ